jgi:hypothetical protein
MPAFCETRSFTTVFVRFRHGILVQARWFHAIPSPVLILYSYLQLWLIRGLFTWGCLTKKKVYVPSVIHKCQSFDSPRSDDVHMMQPAYFGHLWSYSNEVSVSRWLTHKNLPKFYLFLLTVITNWTTGPVVTMTTAQYLWKIFRTRLLNRSLHVLHNYCFL